MNYFTLSPMNTSSYFYHFRFLCYTVSMKYKKNLFGKTIIIDEKTEPSLKSQLDDNQNTQLRGQLYGLHFLAGYLLVWEILCFLDMFFGVHLKITDKNNIINIINAFIVFLLPFIVGLLRLLVIDRFLDKFSWKAKWWFTGITFAGFLKNIQWKKQQ